MKPIYILIAVMVFVFSCGKTITETRRIDHVERVFMHEKTHFTFLVQRPGSANIDTVVFKSLLMSIDLKADVPAEKPMWVSVITSVSGCGGKREHLEIHVHSVKDINPAGWNHGKFGSGQTVIIK